MGSQTLEQLGRLWRHLGRTERRSLALMVPAAALLAGFDLLLILAIARLVQVMLQGGGVPIQRQVLLVLALGWGLAMVRSLFRERQYRLSAVVARSLADQALERLLGQPYGFHLARQRSSLSSLVAQQLPQLSALVITPVLQGIGNLAIVLLLGGGLLFLAGPAALILIALLVAAYGLLALLVKVPLRRWSSEQMALERRSQGLLLDAFANLRTLLLQRSQAEVVRCQRAISGRISVIEGRSAVLPELPRQLVEPVGLSLLLLLLLLPSVRSSGAQSLPWLALVTVAMLRLAQPLQELWRGVNLLQGSLPLLKEVAAVLALPVEPLFQSALPGATLSGAAWPAAAPMAAAQLAVRDLWFRYPDAEAWVLQGVDLELPAGGRVALVGASGSGKSTLAAVLLGLLPPGRGQRWLDGALLCAQGEKAWQQCCAEVAQPVRLLRGSVADNVACWRNGVTEQAIWDALRQAQLAEEISSLPQGLHTLVGEDGIRFSGGQGQRLALARALLSQPRFLVLDEATSALDPRSEALVLEALEAIRGTTTILVIAHRPEMMRRCDRLLLLENGRICDQGAFGELQERSAAFRRLLVAAGSASPPMRRCSQSSSQSSSSA